MADSNTTNPILSLCVTVASRLSALPIEDGQLVFVRDKQRIAFDFNGKRTIYNQIEELSSEAERQSLLAPINGLFYFILDTATLWKYQDGWVQLTAPPSDIVYIGTDQTPELGNVKTLYVNKTDKVISVWDEEASAYVTVSDYTNEATDEDILSLFN